MNDQPLVLFSADEEAARIRKLAAILNVQAPLPLVEQPTAPAPRLTFVEIWRPMWLGSEPRIFWRELLPPADASKARFPSLWKRSEWRVMNSEAATAIKALPNNYFTLDEYPGVTFCWRRFKDKQATEADKRAMRCLRNGTRDVSGELDRLDALDEVEAGPGGEPT